MDACRRYPRQLSQEVREHVAIATLYKGVRKGLATRLLHRLSFDSSISLASSSSIDMTVIPEVTLNTGAKIPLIGLGCVQRLFCARDISLMSAKLCRCWMGEHGGGERAYEMCMKALAVSV